jgi:hypothetical protein
VCVNGIVRSGLAKDAAQYARNSIVYGYNVHPPQKKCDWNLPLVSATPDLSDHPG